MVCISFVFANIISIVDTNIDKSILSGMLCGALTSTPGLSAICESIGINSENAINEIAIMLSGSSVEETAIANAKSLLNQKK